MLWLWTIDGIKYVAMKLKCFKTVNMFPKHFSFLLYLSVFYITTISVYFASFIFYL
jgi:hypothetical protein